MQIDSEDNCILHEIVGDVVENLIPSNSAAIEQVPILALSKPHPSSPLAAQTLFFTTLLLLHAVAIVLLPLAYRALTRELPVTNHLLATLFLHSRLKRLFDPLIRVLPFAISHRVCAFTQTSGIFSGWTSTTSNTRISQYRSHRADFSLSLSILPPHSTPMRRSSGELQQRYDMREIRVISDADSPGYLYAYVDGDFWKVGMSNDFV
ncbi:hypothetical protein C8J55DRAFT_554069 [Lentinula edodes]|uniref:Uncharacterized protein n=1 Tax=Lentinula lateritia TaxID=40482 RepID=A0A9W9B605_9AGAR|nr:hypothetical protein C8J55DRAFT_554069 [Lentinula edodes]